MAGGAHRGEGVRDRPHACRPRARAAPAEIEILPDERGAPRGRGADALERLADAAGGLAHPLAWRRRWRSPPSERRGWASTSSTRRRRARGLRRGGARGGGARAARPARAPTHAEEWLLRLWCAREAAGKAFGAGLAAARAPARRRDRPGTPDACSSRAAGSSVLVSHPPRRTTCVASAVLAGTTGEELPGGSGDDDARPAGARRHPRDPRRSRRATGSTSARSARETRFIADLGLESLEIVVLSTMVQQRYGRLPFPAVLRGDRAASGGGARPERRRARRCSYASTANRVSEEV